MQGTALQATQANRRYAHEQPSVFALETWRWDFHLGAVAGDILHSMGSGCPGAEAVTWAKTPFSIP